MEIRWSIANVQFPSPGRDFIFATAMAEVIGDDRTELQDFTVAVPATLQDLPTIEREVYRRLRGILEQLLATVPSADRG
jgi:hypothetical protein